jgi:mono/diheme cytochrome c family protein
MLGPDLTNVGTKVSREWVYKWLKEPRTITDVDGNVIVNGVSTEPRMPKFLLSEEELRALSAYVSVQRAEPVGSYPRVAAPLKRKGELTDPGQMRFNQIFCVTCHSLSVTRAGQSQLIGGDIGPELTKVGSKVKPDWLVAWLHNPQHYLEHTRMPQFRRTDQDIYDIQQYIQKQLTDPDLLKDVPRLGPPTAAEVQLGKSLFVEKGCAECHVIRGVIPLKNFGPDLSAFSMTPRTYPLEVISTNRHPIPLHFVKGNVTELDISVSKIPRFMISFIQAKVTNPSSVTPETRMPQFHMSQADLDDLTTALLSMTGTPAANATQSLIISRPHPEFHPDGQFGELYQSYKCYVCHKFNGYGGTLAPDLSFEGSRSQREWLIQFLKHPQTIRPTLTVRMPEFNMPDQDATTIVDYLETSLKSPIVDSTTVDAKGFTPEMATRGKQFYGEKYQCQACHTIGSSGGYVGPSLNNAGNWLTPAWIEAWLRNPQALVPGAIEPRQSFTNDEIEDITAYLLTLKQSPESATVAGGKK